MHLRLMTVLLAGSAALAAEPVGPPVAPKRPVADTYQRTQVTDDYRWLEDAASPETRAWAAAQNAWTRSVLDALPGRRAIEARVRQIIQGSSPSHTNLQRAGNRWFALKKDRTKNQPTLVTLTSLDQPGSERVVVDPISLDPSGKTAIDFYQASEDGRWVAVSLSWGGTESGDVHIYDAMTGREQPQDVVPRVNGGTAGGSLAWTRDGSGFFYTRYPRGTERPPEDKAFYQQVWFHRRGTPTDKDRYEVGRDFPRIGETTLETSPDGRWVLASVKNGDGGDVMHHLRASTGTWKQLAAFEDQVREVHFGLDNQLYLRSLKGTEKGQILRLAPGQPLAKATVAAPEGEGAISEFVATRTRLYVAGVVGGPVQVRTYDQHGKPLGVLPLPAVADAFELTRTQKGDDLYLAVVEYTKPRTWYRVSEGGRRIVPTRLQVRSPVDLSAVEVIRDTAVSKDGTRVPMTIIRPKGVPQDGTAPAILTGYGGFAISTTPRFIDSHAVWVEQGGILVEANIRGGGEFGEAWHRAGNLTHKQNVFDDFQACARTLVEKKYVHPGRLGIAGGSNGGLLMGVALTQAPNLYRAVVSRVGIYDMLRNELTSNGTFNITEYGTTKNLDQFHALASYSPYHHVVSGTPYPSILLTTGLNDPRVDSWQSFKMTARLQAATSSKHPVLLRVAETGHGFGSSTEDRIALETDSLSFMFSELALPYKPAAEPAR
jgi:prolyl oligopeptidase